MNIKCEEVYELLADSACVPVWGTVCYLWKRASIIPMRWRVKVGALNNYARLTGKTWGCLVALHDQGCMITKSVGDTV